MKHRRLFISLFALLLLPISAIRPASACMPGVQDAWYDYSITLDDATVPTDVLTVIKPNMLYFLNPTSKVYIIQKDKTDKPAPRPSDLFAPYFSYVQNANQADAIERSIYDYIDAYDLKELGVAIDSHAYSNMDDLKTRPENVSVPEPVNFTLNAYFDEQYKPLKGTITYTLNKDYRPESVESLIRFTKYGCEGLNKSESVLMKERIARYVTIGVSVGVIIAGVTTIILLVVWVMRKLMKENG